MRRNNDEWKRVLRNRRAAQSSRERKRQEVEALENEKRAIERTNQDLLMRLQDMEAKNLILQRQLEQFTGNMTVFRGSSATSSPGRPEQIRQAPTPITFSQELFSSRDEDNRASISTQSIVDSQPTPRTVNPASLSPEIKPVMESTSNASSSDMTQHPAAMLCDLQCQSEEQRPWMDTTTITTSAISQILAATLYLSMASEAISTLLSPLSQIVSSLKNGILPIADSFDLNYDYLVGDHDGLVNDFNIDDFLHHNDDQPAPEVQPSDSLAETTASLQPQLGASSYGCDDGGNAVSV